MWRVMRRPGRECGGNVGHKFRRPAQRELHSELCQQMARAAGNAAVKNIADDGGLQSLQRLLVLQDGEGVEQRLRGMLVHAVPGIDDGDVEMLRHQVRRARRRVANHDAVGADGAQGVAGVEQGLAFFDARSGGLHQRGDGAERFRCEFKRRARAGGSFIKQKYDALAAQQRTGLLRIHAAGQLQQAQDFLRVEVFNPQQRTACGLIHGLVDLTYVSDTFCPTMCKRCIIRGRRGGCKGEGSCRRK